MSRIPSPYGAPRAYGSPSSKNEGPTAPSPRQIGGKRAPTIPTSSLTRMGLQQAPAQPPQKSPSKGGAGGSTLRKEMGRVTGLALSDVDTADVDKLRAAAAGAVKMEARLQEVEVERARELRELQQMMSNLQRKEEELSKFVTAVQKRRQETDPYEKVRAEPASPADLIAFAALRKLPAACRARGEGEISKLAI